MNRKAKRGTRWERAESKEISTEPPPREGRDGIWPYEEAAIDQISRWPGGVCLPDLAEALGISRKAASTASIQNVDLDWVFGAR